jgi:predicted sugar kinase
MTAAVTITTGARLHFGLLVLGERERRRYGGIGLMIDRPRFVLTVRRAQTDGIEASREVAPRIAQFLSLLRADGGSPGWEVSVAEEIPAHIGLGSGTQLGLALAAAVSRLKGEAVLPAVELARRVARSKRSTIGTVGFEAGGFLIDPGAASMPVRHDFPAEWRFVLATPRGPVGLSGELERQAFRELPPMAPSTVARLQAVQRELQTAVTTHNFDRCSASLYEFGRSVGEYFAPIQHGVFADPRMAALAEQLRAQGICGVGQTSWGPTLFALCDGAQRAEAAAAMIRSARDWSDCDVRIVAAKNDGAVVATTHD